MFFEQLEHLIDIDCHTLIAHMLEPDITKRATLDQVLKSAWMQKSTFSSLKAQHKEERQQRINTAETTRGKRRNVRRLVG